jgi:hypothetical protein
VRKKVISRNKLLLLSLLTVGLLSAFQNCSRISFQALNELYSPQKSQNNGEGYPGKPDGDFYRFVPDFTCEQKVAPVAHINITGNIITLSENKKLLCGAVSQQLDEGLIDKSIYQNEIIGYQEGIFEGQAIAPSSIPANLVEVWCKDRNDEQGIETITHFDHVTNLAMNRIYYTQNGAQTQIPDFSVARVVANKTVIVKDEKGFELIVHRDQPAPQAGLFKAQLTATISGQKINRETVCRLGGSLDPKVWPAKQIVDFNVANLKTSPDLNSLGYASNTATGVLNLYAINTDGTKHIQVSPNLPVSGVSNYIFSLDSQSLIYSADARLPGIRELFKFTFANSSLVQLSNRLVNADQGIDLLQDFKLSDDGFSVIYGDGSFAVPTLINRPTWLQSVPLSGAAAPRALTPPPSMTLWGAKQFIVSKNKVAYLCCDIKSDFYSVNIDGSGLIKITPPMPSDWSFSTVTPVSGIGDYVYANAFSSTPGQLRGYIVAIDGSDFVELPVNQIFDETILSPTHAVIYKIPCSDESCARQLLNLKAKTLINLPTLIGGARYPDSTHSPRLFFTKDSAALIGSKALSDGKLQAVSISTAAGEVKDLCPGVTSPQLIIKEIGQNKFSILAYDQSLQILNIYITQDSLCKKVNSAVATNPQLDFLQDVSISGDSLKAIIKLSAYGTVPDKYTLAGVPKASQLLYVPLNGKPAVIVDAPAHEAGTISQAVFLNDSRTVLFIGDQIRTLDQNIFLWTAPAD